VAQSKNAEINSEIIAIENNCSVIIQFSFHSVAIFEKIKEKLELKHANVIKWSNLAIDLNIWAAAILLLIEVGSSIN
jgi:hypothetical protein